MSRHRTVSRKLPPLLSINQNEGRIASPHHAASYSSPPASRYHQNCYHSTRPPSPGPGAYLDAIVGRSPISRAIKSPKSSRPAKMEQPGTKTFSALKPQKIEEFLDFHTEFLEEYVLKKVDLQLLERWIIRKMQRQSKESQKMSCRDGDKAEQLSLSRWKFCVHADKREMLQELTSSLYTSPSKAHVLTELAKTVASSVGATKWSLYIYDPNSQELAAFGQEENDANVPTELRSISVQEGTSLAAYVARTKETVRIKSTDKDLRFPRGVSLNSEVEAFVLCHPILQPDGELSGVLELYRSNTNSEFHEEDEEIVNSYLVWGGIALHYAELYGSMMRQRELNSFLLTVVKSIFQDMVSMDTLITKIMVFARKLVNADRASLFLVDGKSGELFARIFDVSDQEKTEEIGKDVKGSREIRFPIDKGIAGHVAKTGECLNIPDAYNDDRFNRSVDQQTGYVTRNLLCMPIFIRGSVIGVVQMVNKATGSFTKHDEEAFATFAVYCGLALHHAKLYDKIRRSEQKYKVALEILSYHNTCTEDEINAIKNVKLSIRPEALREFNFSPSILSSDEKVAAAIFMVTDMFRRKNTVKIEPDCLLRFTLTVRKNYRRVPYHNWAHGFAVANSAYVILQHCPNVFTPVEALALFVACLCHDLDHRGKTNQFLASSASPLAAIYTTSTLEHHHFNMTVSILQNEGHNILKNLSSSEYKQVLANIKHCILSTDLALFFPNKAKLSEIVKGGKFDWNSLEHRQLLQAIMMTACDLCASTKSWEQQKETVKVIFQEFYDQGDVEKAQGLQPIPMMDRDKVHEQPASQVSFLVGICIPCYELLYSLLPQCKPLLDKCRSNLAKWEALANQEK